MNPILSIAPLQFPWQTVDPFLFCVHHDDRYPAANGRFGPDASLAGRNIGQDFEGIDGWRMYHGTTVPGFPYHPHRGFETVTLVRRGFIDHSDSLGATARYGEGDVQWLTAGRGIQHAEMFPLLDTKGPNLLELFQIWMNLPSRSKMADPHFTMLWAEDIPRHVFGNGSVAGTEVMCVAGTLDGSATAETLSPPPESWASDPANEVAIWTIRMQRGARWTIPAAHSTAHSTAHSAAPGVRRNLYFFAGARLEVAGRVVDRHSAIALDAGAGIDLVNVGDDEAEMLLLQGRPIGEPVAQYGPFVMNTQQELRQAFADYQRTQFGGWPWKDGAPVHGEAAERFARHADGREERRGRSE